MKPATRYPAIAQVATVSEYGSCVDTWSMWLHPEPAEERIVVSEIGEQWSPKTEPASVAERATIIMSGMTEWVIGTMIGIRMPNVPQAVPVEKDRNAAITKMAAGRQGDCEVI